MPLGTRDFSIDEGDLVKVTLNPKYDQVIPWGTIAPVSKIISGPIAMYQLKGFEDTYLNEFQMELVSYIRKGAAPHAGV